MAGVMQAFENIAMAKIAKSAHQAKDLGYLRASDKITMNRDRVLSDGKTLLLNLSQNYLPPQPHEYYLPGPSGKAALQMALNDLQLLGLATPHDMTVVGMLAHILCGGDDADITKVMSEDDILKLERIGISELAKNPLGLARMEHMLTKGKPLRN